MNSTTQQLTYELLKDLPDGAKAGDKYYKRGDQYFNDKIKTDDSPVVEYNSYFTWQVEPNVDWFRKVEVKDWEVVAFLIKQYDEVIEMGGYGVQKVEYYLDRPKAYSIFKVRRLSDGEIFRVGDTVGWGIPNDYETKIESFRLRDGCLEFKDNYSFIDFEKTYKLHKKLPHPLVEQETIKDNKHPFRFVSSINLIGEHESNDGYRKSYKYDYQFTLCNGDIKQDEFPELLIAITNALQKQD